MNKIEKYQYKGFVIEIRFDKLSGKFEAKIFNDRLHGDTYSEIKKLIGNYIDNHLVEAVSVKWHRIIEVSVPEYSALSVDNYFVAVVNGEWRKYKYEKWGRPVVVLESDYLKYSEAMCFSGYRVDRHEEIKPKSIDEFPIHTSSNHHYLLYNDAVYSGLICIADTFRALKERLKNYLHDGEFYKKLTTGFSITNIIEGPK